jgi:spermidine synthase
MGGLGFGARIGGAWGDRRGEVGPRYARLEFGIGVLGLLAPWTLQLIDSIFAALQGAGGIWLKALLAFAALAPATLLMGATLPLVARAALHDEAETQRAVGLLYGWNTLGAVLGVLLTQFFLVTRIGMSGRCSAAAGWARFRATWQRKNVALARVSATRHGSPWRPECWACRSRLR